MVPETLISPRLSRADAARTVAHFLAGDGEPLIVADWPEDISLFNALLVTGPGVMGNSRRHLPVRPLTGFRTAANSKVPAQRAARRARAARSFSVWNDYSAAVRKESTRALADRPR